MNGKSFFYKKFLLSGFYYVFTRAYKEIKEVNSLCPFFYRIGCQKGVKGTKNSNFLSKSLTENEIDIIFPHL